MSDAAFPARPRALTRVVRTLWAFVLGTLAACTAPTALLLLGWLQQRMDFVVRRAAGLPAARPGWIMGATGTRGLVRLFGGLGGNIRAGVLAFLSLGLASLPFSAIWLLSWWAGWENSFSKGYEQAFVGPFLALSGIALFAILMVFIPLGLAHHAVEARPLALFELRRVRAVYRETGWGYVLLSLATVVMALPVFAGRGLITFADSLIPGLSDMTPDEIANMVAAITLLKAAYTVLALMFLRSWLARIYARAACRAVHRHPQLWAGTVLSAVPVEQKPRWRGPRWLRTAALLVIWSGLAAQIFVAQFLNYTWWVWLTHPFWLLPMAM